MQRENVVHGWPSARSPRVTVGMSSSRRSPTSLSRNTTLAEPCRPIGRHRIGDSTLEGGLQSGIHDPPRTGSGSILRVSNRAQRNEITRKPVIPHFAIRWLTQHTTKKRIIGRGKFGMVTELDDDALACHTCQTLTRARRLSRALEDNHTIPHSLAATTASPPRRVSLLSRMKVCHSGNWPRDRTSPRYVPPMKKRGSDYRFARRKHLSFPEWRQGVVATRDDNRSRQ